MPNSFLIKPLADWLASITLSGICSISPAPKTGVGILKMRLLALAAASKSGCARTQGPGGPVVPIRPESVAVLCTPPSRVPSGLNLNRASLIGPFTVMKKGT